MLWERAGGCVVSKYGFGVELIVEECLGWSDDGGVEDREEGNDGDHD